MPGDLGPGQTVALTMFAAGCLGLSVVAAWYALRLRAAAVIRLRSVLAGALMIIAGLALLLVRRLDPAALARVVADLAAAMPAAHFVPAWWKEAR